MQGISDDELDSRKHSQDEHDDELDECIDRAMKGEDGESAYALAAQFALRGADG